MQMMHAKGGVAGAGPRLVVCEGPGVVRMSCPLGVLVYLGCLCIFRATFLWLGRVEYVRWINIVVAQQTWILLPFLWRNFKCREYVLWIRVTNNGVTWGLELEDDPRYCSLLDKGCFALV